ncbi:MAG: nitroreductase family protein [Candidatus Methanomethylicia archaeon]
MEVSEAIKVRRSIRKYRSDPIPEEYLIKILEAGRLAPSAGNRQPWHFIIVRDKSLKEEIVKAARNQRFIGEADAVLIVLSNPEASPRWYLQDPMIAAENMVLQATELGLGTCYIGAFDEAEVKRILDIPEKFKVICLLPIGYPDETPPPKPRKPLTEIVSQEKYGNPIKLG